LVSASWFFHRRLHAGADVWTGIGPQGASFSLVATTPANPSLVFALDFGGAFLRSTDGGVSWSRMTSGLFPVTREPQAAAIAPSDAATAYLAALDSAAGTFGIYKTTDGGTSWAASGATNVNNAGPVVVLIHPSNAQIVWVGTFLGIFRTTDGGASWTQASGYFGKVNALAVDPSNPANIYAAVQDVTRRVLKSTDGGATFNDANAGLPPMQSVFSVAIDPTTAPSTIYASPGSPGVLYKSTDAGASWSPAATGINPNATVFSLLAIPGPSASLLVGTTSGVYRSLDSGATWSDVDPSFAPHFFRSLARDFASPGGAYAASAIGLMRLPAGSFALLPISSASLGLKYWGWVVRGDPASASKFYAGTPGGLFLTTDDGSSWTDVSGNLPDDDIVSLLVIPNLPQSILVVGTNQTIWRSSDGGATWAATSALILNASQLVADPVVQGRAWAATQSGLFVSTDYGATWSRPSTGIGISDPGVYRSAVDPKNPNTVYAGSGHGEDGDGLYKSADGGLTWTQTPLKFGYIWALAVNPVTPTTIYTAGYAGLTSDARTYDLWKSIDGGISWSQIPIPGASGFLINELVVDPLATSTVWAAIDNGLYRSLDGGASWATANQGLPANPIVQSFQISPGDSKTYLAGNLNGGGAFSFRSNPTGPLISGGGTFDTPDTIEVLTPTGGATVAFSSLSVSGSGGSVAVSVGAPPTALRAAAVAPADDGRVGALFPCTPVERRNTYDVSASLLIPAGQTVSGSGRVEVNWYSDFFCNSLLSSDATHPVADPPSRWKTVSLGKLRPPKGAVRARIGLFVTEHNRGGTFTVNFDDVVFREVCDSPTAKLQGDGIVEGGHTATLSVALTGLSPWTLKWSDGFVQEGIITSPAERVVSPVHTTHYEIDQVTDAFCNKGFAGGGSIVLHN
jgi:photosystem II stability/assembly factor-like uncharacterized protein